MSEVVLLVAGTMTPAAIQRVCSRVGTLFETHGVEELTVDVSGVVDPDASAIDALARLQLTAKRAGRRIRIVHACPEMRGLLELAGLTDVVPLGVEPDR